MKIFFSISFIFFGLCLSLVEFWRDAIQWEASWRGKEEL